jgi:putative FmdB family regulatory protein
MPVLLWFSHAATLGRMARYEYRCRACGATFEQTRPMAEANSPAECPAGHTDTVKLFSAVAVGGRASGPAPSAGGGCCGGGCCS